MPYFSKLRFPFSVSQSVVHAGAITVPGTKANNANCVSEQSHFASQKNMRGFLLESPLRYAANPCLNMSSTSIFSAEATIFK